MSKGLSWRQRSMLKQLAQVEANSSPIGGPPTPWRMLDYGPSHAYNEANGTPDQVRASWNIEQAQRRALRNLEARGLVTLGRYAFYITEREWVCVDPDTHVPGETRIMTGVLLTDAGREIVKTFVAE